jgi:hypothetical protein
MRTEEKVKGRYFTETLSPGELKPLVRFRLRAEALFPSQDAGI